ncbi:MAG: VC0807 family protein [Acetobacteraceae bacterium]
MRLARLITRRRAGIAFEILVNLVLPWVFWRLAKPRFGEVHAIMASAAPPILWSLAEFAHRRRIDSLSVLVLSGIALSLAGFALGGSPRLLLVRESLITGLIGLAFIASAALGRPLVYVLARAGLSRRSAADRAAFESQQGNPAFRHLFTIITVVWGIGLVAETSLRVTLAFTLPVGRYLIVGPIIGYATIGLLVLWAFLYARRAPADP